ncbi:MAG: hypothetical protein NC453_10305 [Muribaculum sp.]|nr:hypothetical protein [Muribaculum sp.]
MSYKDVVMTLPFVDQEKPFSYIVWGFLFHSLGRVFLNVTHLQIAYAFVCCLGWLYILRGFYLLRHELYWQLSGKQRVFLFVYMALCLIMIVRGYTIDYKYLWLNSNGFINYHLFNPTYILPYLMPFVLLIPTSEYDFRPIVKVSVVLSVVVIICFALFYKEIIYSSVRQSLGILQSTDSKAEDYMYYGQLYANVAIIALCRKYVSARIWFLNTVALILTLMINLMAARRGTSVTMFAILLFDVYFLVKSFSFRARLIISVMAAVIIGASSVLLYNFNGFDYIKKRGMQDSRSHIDIALMEQMTDEQLIFGKGLNGRYYYDLHLAWDYLGGWRYVSETGYYNLILKGGYLLAWTYILFLLYPAYMGIFKSRNLLCKALGFLIFLSLLELYPFGHLSFNLKFLILWMGIAINSDPELRELDDDEISQRYFKTDEDTLDN